ncbi:MAG: hypothetical protein ACI9FU_001678 [Granulosicoccus sp.]|jgi:hypothetical protein
MPVEFDPSNHSAEHSYLYQMRSLSLLAIILLTFSAAAQKWVGQSLEHPLEELKAKSHFTQANVGHSHNEFVSHLKDVISNLHDEKCGVELIESVQSPLGNHLLFQQTINGEKVMGATIKINIDNDGLRSSLFDRTITPDLAIEMEFPDTALIRLRLNELYRGDDMDELFQATVERAYFYNGQNLVPSVRIEVVEAHDHYYEMVLDHDVKVIYQNDLLAYHHSAQIDSPVTAFVFLPDPLTTAEETYGSPYADQNDASIAQLNEQRQEVTMEADFGGTFFNLLSEWVIFSEHTPPTNTPAISSTPMFDFTRDNDRFEEVNAYYHINNFQQHIQDLGFDNLVNYQISVDVHALNSADNSNFNNGHTPPRLSFGDGGVDDAEDADVIIHEYGHAIMHSAAPATNGGTERRALDEANGDYFAASYSRHLAPFGWERVYSWDGHNEFWSGRMATSTGHYPEDLVGNIYQDGVLWSSTLMEIWGDIGRDKTDKILMQSAYSYAEGMSMTDAAWLFIEAEELLYAAEYTYEIRQRMFDRGFIPWVGVSESAASQDLRILNSELFAQGKANLVIEFEQQTDAVISVIDAMGRTIIKEEISSKSSWELSANKITTTGFYTISIVDRDGYQGVKIVRIR